MMRIESDIAIRSKEIMNDFLNLTGMTTININIDEYCSIRNQAAKELSHYAINQQEKATSTVAFSAVPFMESKSDELRQTSLDIKPVVDNTEKTNCQNILGNPTSAHGGDTEDANASVTTNPNSDEADCIPQNKENLSDRKRKELEILNRIPER